MLSYTALTDDQRECWDAMVEECEDCQALVGDDALCPQHDLDRLTDTRLDAMIAAWRD